MSIESKEWWKTFWKQRADMARERFLSSPMCVPGQFFSGEKFFISHKFLLQVPSGI
jgi:hypothetical protein